MAVPARKARELPAGIGIPGTGPRSARIAVGRREVTIAGPDDVPETLLAPRQREALDVALGLGYYEVPWEASHEDVADALDCAPSTAAEHLRKAEAKVLRGAVD